LIICIFAQKTVEQADKINEMTAVMQHALKLDEEESNKDKELFAQLITENKVGQIRPVVEQIIKFRCFS
jgi:SIKE family